MTAEIKIQAQITAHDTCQFTIDRPLLDHSSAFFLSKEQAVDSPFVGAIFDLPSVSTVMVSHNILRVTKAGYDDWVPIAKQIGSIIRSHLGSTGQLFSPTLTERSPAEMDLRKRLMDVFDREINPMVAQHGGFVNLVDVRDTTVYLQLGGGCQGCGMAAVTLRQGIESILRRVAPDVTEILDITDHAGGRNPYFAASAR